MKMVAGKSFGLVMILLIVLAAEQMVEHTEARLCESQSHSFKGQCWSDHNCGLVCKSEGPFVGGKCRGFRHRCFCAKNC